MEWSQQEVDEVRGSLHEIVDLLGDIKALLTPPSEPRQCPGEDDCQIFQTFGSRSDTPLAKALNLCTRCPLFASKPIREIHQLRT